MFQNIAEEEKIDKALEEAVRKDKIDLKEIVKKLFTKQNILVYIISFMLSTVSTSSGIAPFGLAIFAAVLSNGLPAMIVFVMALIRNTYWYRWRRNSNIYINCPCVYWNGFDF